MTFEELDALYPNGFDDAEIEKLVLDYRNRTVEMQVNLRRNLPDRSNCDEYQRAILLLRRFYYFVTEPPDADHLLYPERPIQVTGYPEDAKQFPIFEHLKSKLSSSAFCCRFYVHDWNSFIHIAASDAQLSWVGDAAPTSPPSLHRGGL